MPLNFYISPTGAVIYQNHHGLIFYTCGEPPKDGGRLLCHEPRPLSQAAK